MRVPSTSRLRFAEFTLSPRQRLLLRHQEPVALIPKYFDLLVLLIRRRHEAVSKDDIFGAVWPDVVVSDGALAQAVRTLRRTLGDDVREPRFIRTVSRHGYQFVFAAVTEEDDDRPIGSAGPPPAADAPLPVAPLVEQLLVAQDTSEARDLAERLHAIDTGRALAELTQHPHHAPAVAMMREARWSVPTAGHVPLLADAEAPGAIAALIRLRLADVQRLLARRLAGATLAGAAGGAIAGVTGGLVLVVAPGSHAPAQSIVALAAIGAAAGSIGACGVGLGLLTAEALARSRRSLALVACGAAAGALTGLFAAQTVQALLQGLFGLTVGTAGAIEGLVVGGSAATGYAAATAGLGGGLAAPRGRRRLGVVAAAGLACAIGGLLLAALHRPLIGGLIHGIARTSHDAGLGLGPLGGLVGEPDFGDRTQRLLSAFEGLIFGLSLATGMTRRPRSPGEPA